MNKIQTNVQIVEDVHQDFQKCRDTFGHGNGWAIVSAALRAFLSLSHAERVAAIRSEHDLDMADKLNVPAPSPQPPAPKIPTHNFDERTKKPGRGSDKRKNGAAG